MAEQGQVKQVKERHKESILTKPNVVGVGTGYKVSKGETTDELSVVVLVREKKPIAGLPPEALVRREYDGVRTDVVDVGDLRALADHRARHRPAPAGVSIGHYQITAGTFGCVVRDRDSSERLMLSNNHVLANSNDATIGDPILQPGPTDGGTQPDDVIGHLLRFCPIEYATGPAVCGTAASFATLVNTVARMLGHKHQVEAVFRDPEAVNLVDAALARPVNDADILDEILEIGVVTGTAPAKLGMAVRKSGRTTGFTTGTITVLDATVTVSYSGGRTARFEDQIITTPMSAGGDSGSLLVAGDDLKAVGLLFAGSDRSTIHSPIQAVLDCLDVTI